MNPVSLLREVAVGSADAWRITANAFAAAGLLPLFAIWGLGLGTAEALAWLEPDSDGSAPAASPSHLATPRA